MHALPQSVTGVFFLNNTATTEIYTLSLHDALPTSTDALNDGVFAHANNAFALLCAACKASPSRESQIGRAHAELQSRPYLVFRLLLANKKDPINFHFADVVLSDAVHLGLAT